MYKKEIFWGVLFFFFFFNSCYGGNVKGITPMNSEETWMMLLTLIGVNECLSLRKKHFIMKLDDNEVFGTTWSHFRVNELFIDNENFGRIFEG